jgi:hypothetical protein
MVECVGSAHTQVNRNMTQTWFLLSNSKRRLDKAGRRCLASGVLLGTSCTLSNAVNDDPAGNMPSNIYLNGPSERSLSLWATPGENALAALAEVEANDRDRVLPVDNRILGSFMGEVGAYFSATTIYTPFNEALRSQTMQCEQSDLPDAVETLCASIAAPRRADDDSVAGPIQLVLVNELEHVAYQRSLMRKLLSCAWEAGFRYLGVEALEEDDAALEARGFVSRSESGELTREPQMARLIAEATQRGYDIVSYEVADRCSDCRHLEAIKMYAEQQAANLVAKTFAIDPEAKVLVLTSARQAYKQIWGSAPYTKSLGAHLWEQTGLEPYSIEQVAVDRPSLQFGASAPNPASGMYGMDGEIDGRCMGSYGTGSPTGMSTLDAIVIHVPPHVDAERWDWLHAPADERRSVTATCADCTPGERLLVQAFPAGTDRSDRMPLDQALCSAGEPCQLALPADRYDIVVWSESAEVGVSQADLQASTTAAVGGP